MCYLCVTRNGSAVGMYVSGHRDVDELDASRSRGAPLETLSKRFRVDDGGGGGGGGENHVGFLQHVPHLVHELEV